MDAWPGTDLQEVIQISQKAVDWITYRCMPEMIFHHIPRDWYIPKNFNFTMR